MFAGVRLGVFMTISLSSFSRPAARLPVVLTLVLGLCGGAATTGAAPAQAVVTATTANGALAYARSRNGAPDRYGAVGPSRFDCSGLTKWSYARAGKTLPRTTTQQYAATIRVSKASRRPGDLVFFKSGSSIYHVGIYAGANRVWHAPHTGDHVRLAIIWTSAVAYGRVR
jgi:cell wall-associated NlpC family hydrolase